MGLLNTTNYTGLETFPGIFALDFELNCCGTELERGLRRGEASTRHGFARGAFEGNKCGLAGNVRHTEGCKNFKLNTLEKK